MGTIAAILYPMDDITDFLYLIGSVFAPMIAILLADYFINRQQVQTLSAYLVRGTYLGRYPLVYTTICYIVKAQ